MNATRRLIVVLGPTASGKSALAIRLAEEFHGEIVACDSTQVYRHFDIGTGKVPVSDRRGIPHHMMDLVEPDKVFTAGQYRTCASRVLEDITARGRLPILTAGTGLYLRALLEGLSDAPGRSEELRGRLRRLQGQRGSIYLHRMLKRLDLKASSRIAPGDSQKVIRAIEVRILAGRTLTEIHCQGREGLEGFLVAKIGLMPPRAALYARINRRVEEMISAGWANEVRDLMGSGIPADAKPFSFIGYAQLAAHLEGKIPLSDAVREIQMATRRYAKRQITWFGSEEQVQWNEYFGSEQALFQAIIPSMRKTIAEWQY
jgi:tRNA dimethylallyltransferase